MSFFELFHNYEQPVELLAAAAIFAWPLARRTKQRPWGYCLAGIAALWAACACIMPLFPEEMVLIRTYVYVFSHSVASFGTAALAVYLWCEVRAETALYCATLAYLMQHISYCICCFLMPGSNSSSTMSFAQNLGYVVMVLAVYSAVYLLFGVRTARRLLSGGQFLVNLRGTLLVMLASLGVALGLSLVVHMHLDAANPLYRCCHLYAILCCGLLLWGQVDLHNRLEQQHALDLQRQLWLRSKAQYERAADGVKLINQKCHALKVQLANFKRMAASASSDATQQAVREMEQTVSIYDSMVDTGNEILDTILNEKSLLCAAQNIAFTCIADGRAVEHIETVDLFTMLGSALDNAMEAVDALTDLDRRTISVSIFTGQGVSILQVENYFAGELTFEDGLPVTTKGDPEERGFGLKGIRRTAEKYGGVMAVRVEAGMFLLRITLPRE